MNLWTHYLDMSMSRYSEEFANIDFENPEDVFDLVHSLHQMNKIDL